MQTEEIEPEEKKKRGKVKKVSHKKQKRIKIALGIVCALVIVGILVISNLSSIFLMFGIGDTSSFSGDLSGNKKHQKLAIKQTLYDNLNADISFGDENVINILVFGLDRNEARTDDMTIFRPDTIILASVNLEDKTIKMTSIPRDTYVSIYGRGGKDKVNAAFYYGSLGKTGEEEIFQGGIECLKGTVSDLLGVPVNYYVGIDMDGVDEIIDTLGGVEVDVHTDVYVMGDLRVPKGKRVLSGYEFLTYARCRDYVRGDIDRVEVQQRLLKTLFEQVTSSGNIMKLPKVLSQTFDMIVTDISFKQLTSLAFTMKDFSVDNIQTGTVPGMFGNMNNISYWIVDQSALRTYVKDMYGVTISGGTQDPTSDRLTRLSLHLSSTTLTEGSSASFSISGYHANGVTKAYSASSCDISVSDSSVISVSGSTITARGAGTATITVSYNGISTSVTITVKAKEAPAPTPSPEEDQPEKE